MNKHYSSELFTDKASAEAAYRQALQSGYTDKDINVIMSEGSKKKYFDSVLVEKVPGNDALEGAGVGGTLGAAVGGSLAAIAAIGTNIVFPGVGLVVAGPLAAGLAGAGAGAISGGLMGALVGWGIPEDKAKIYEKGIKDGGIVLAIDDTDSPDQLSNQWNH
ncbi:MAG: hypothetical protein EPN84_01505 [Legionella sp.]|nr:MAG: hypothetical protein EPN84_01505 [Legionella sp.]